MDYDSATAQVVSYGASLGSSAAIRPADFNALCQQLERNVERIWEHSHRIRDHADRMFGSRPEPATGLPKEATATTLSGLIERMGEAINSVENGLSRL